MARRQRLNDQEQSLISEITEELLAIPSTNLPPQVCKELARMVGQVAKVDLNLTNEVGPLCSTAVAASWLSISRQALHKQVEAGKVLALRSSDGKWFYPTWQFTARNTVAPGLAQVLPEVMRLTQLTRANWFMRPCEDLGGTTPAQWLLDEKPTDKAVTAAQNKVNSLRRKRQKAQDERAIPPSADIPTQPIAPNGTL